MNNTFGRALDALRLILSVAFVICLGIELLFPSKAASAEGAGGRSLELTNVAEQVTNNPSYPENKWSWTAYVSADKATIDRIRCVVYTLHPTFAQPVVKVCKTVNALYPFSVSALGWGTFTLLARVEFLDGKSENLSHFLSFSLADLTIEENTDRPGTPDVDYYNAETSDLYACQELCKKDTRCKSYTFLPPYSSPNEWHGPSAPHCWLKSAQLKPTRYEGLFSGVRNN